MTAISCGLRLEVRQLSWPLAAWLWLKVLQPCLARQAAAQAAVLETALELVER